MTLQTQTIDNRINLEIVDRRGEGLLVLFSHDDNDLIGEQTIEKVSSQLTDKQLYTLARAYMNKPEWMDGIDWNPNHD